MRTYRLVLFFRSRTLAFGVFAHLVACATTVSAAILYESGTLGATGTPYGATAATNINQFVFPGVRFQLTEPAITSQVGGHFVSASAGTFFGAIVALDDENDFPNSSDLSTPDVLGATILTFPVLSAEVFGDLAIALDPGWYGLIFGSGQFGASGDGVAPRNNSDTGTPSYIGFGPNLGWFNLDILQTPFVDHRFLVTGTVVPEPSALAICLLLLVSYPAVRHTK